MYILSKAACAPEQLQDRKEKGFKHIEIQLTKEFFKNSAITRYQHIMSNDWDIQHIHMPFIPNESDLPLEYIGQSECTNVFLNACRLAQECAEFYNHDISLIIHTNIPLQVLQYLPDSLDKIKQSLKLAMSVAPNIFFSIENGALYSVRNDDIWINPNSLDGNVVWAKYLNKEFKTSRFKTTIDICHLLMTRKMMDFLIHDKQTAHLEKTINWFFEQNKDTINNIHLNNMHEFGLKRDHSETFNESNLRDMEILASVFELYKRYNLDCNITLEIEELDYSDAKKAFGLDKLIRNMFSEYIELS